VKIVNILVDQPLEGLIRLVFCFFSLLIFPFKWTDYLNHGGKRLISGAGNACQFLLCGDFFYPETTFSFENRQVNINSCALSHLGSYGNVPLVLLDNRIT
jgi:hypothetical protein